MSSSRVYVGETKASSIPDKEVILTPEEQVQVERRIAGLQKLLKHDRLGKFKLEVLFVKDIIRERPVLGGLVIHESGKRFHGGGDVKVYICPGSRRGVNECSAVIPSASHSDNKALCPGCGVLWPETELVGEILGRHYYQDWAKLIMKYLGKVQGDADILVTHSESLLQLATQRELVKRKGSTVVGMGGAKLGEVRTAREKHMRVYPLPNMVKDTAAGADMLNRIYRFLVA